MKKWTIRIISFLGLPVAGILLLIMCVVIVIVGAVSQDDSASAQMVEFDFSGTGIYIDSVEQWREEVEKACAKYQNNPFKKQCGNLTDYVNLALAIMTEESHGNSVDPMQASLCGFNTKYPKNWREGYGITDPVYSIECGVQYMRNALITAKVTSPTDFGRIGVAAQGYNFGVEGWCNWIKKHGGVYTVELAEKYRVEVMGGKGTPTHGEKVLNTYKTALSKITSNSIVDENGNTITIDTSNVASLISLNEVNAWKLVTNGKFSAKPSPGSVTASDCSAWMKQIDVKVWGWKYPKGKGTEKTTVTYQLTVNKNLASFWISFFNEVYKNKIVIAELSCYTFRMNTPGTALSSHSFGTAIDINWSTTGNGYGQTPYTATEWKKLKKGRTKELTIYEGSPLVQIAKNYSLDWGGEWSSTKDGMHFSFCGDNKRAG